MPSAHGYDLVLQTMHCDESDFWCAGYTGVTVRQPSRIVVVSDRTADPERAKTVAALEAELRRRVGARQWPCSGPGVTACHVSREPVASNLLVYVADSAAPPSPEAEALATSLVGQPGWQ